MSTVHAPESEICNIEGDLADVYASLAALGSLAAAAIGGRAMTTHDWVIVENVARISAFTTGECRLRLEKMRGAAEGGVQ